MQLKLQTKANEFCYLVFIFNQISMGRLYKNMFLAVCASAAVKGMQL